jgi:hypothetical protein
MSEYEVLVNPVVIGIEKRLNTKSRRFFVDYKNNLIKTALTG